MKKNISSVISLAIVGGGPAGFFCAKRLLKHLEISKKSIRIDLFDRLPLPFGLIRYGVAPDAPDLKKAQNELSTIAEDTRFHFFGNIQIGRDLKVEQLAKIYSGIIFSYGASEEYQLNIEGEHFSGVCSGKEIAQWYNGHFDYSNLEIDFSKIRNVSIIGNGNVALDVARILSRKTEELALTDINRKAYKMLLDSKIENIFIIARRGPLESAFSLKELRDFSKLSYVDFYAVKDELLTPVLGLQSIPRAEKRKIEFMQKTFKIFQNIQEMNEVLSIKSDKKRIIFRYLLSPTKINGLNGSVSSVEYQPNVLTIKDGIQIAAKKTNAQLETIHTQLFIKSVGYKSIKIDESILFDPIKNIIPNKEGKILKVDNTIERGKYVAGWIKTGPKGTIANTFNDCEETIANILADIENNELEEKNYNLGKEINFKKVFMPRIKIFLDAILDLLKKKDLKFYSFDDWKLIDEYEKSMGLKIGKPREKIITIDELENVLKLIKI